MNDKPKELEEHSAQIFELGCMERPVYLKEDVDAVIAGLKARIHELENMPHTDNSAVIELLENENAQLKEQYRDMDVTHTVHIAKMNALIEELEESQRWRKCSEEKPEGEGDYLVMACYPDDDELHIEICLYDMGSEDFGHYERRYAGSGNSFGGFDGEEWVTHNVSFWRPLPSAPKEDK